MSTATKRIPGATSHTNLETIRKLLRENPGATIKTQRGIGATYYKIVDRDPLAVLKRRAELAFLTLRQTSPTAS
jgi:hypothetical protein